MLRKPEDSQANSASLRPHVAFTPEACGEVLRALRRAVAAFARWDVPVPPGTWIDEAEVVLSRIVERQSVGDSDDELRRASAAVAWAVDLYHISTCLGEEAVRSVAIELARITHGRLLTQRQSAAKTFLSQFWVGALLAQSKLKPEIRVRDVAGKSKPDFHLPVGGVYFVVEVKRPSTPGAARRVVSDAADQIRRVQRPGIIIVDATDCMSSDPFAVTDDPNGVVPIVRRDLNRLHGRLEGQVKKDRRSDKYQHVAMIMTFARYWPWVRGEAAQRSAGILFRASVLPYLWSWQIPTLAKVVQDGLIEGVAQLTGNPPEFTYY